MSSRSCATAASSACSPSARARRPSAADVLQRPRALVGARPRCRPRRRIRTGCSVSPRADFLVVDGTPTGEPPDAAREPDGAARTLRADLHAARIIMHGSIGPSAAMAQWDGEQLTVWSHSQGVYVLRDALAAALDVRSRRRAGRPRGRAGLLRAQRRRRRRPRRGAPGPRAAGRPVLLKWTRSDEHMWEPYGPPALVQMQASLDDRRPDHRLAPRGVGHDPPLPADARRLCRTCSPARTSSSRSRVDPPAALPDARSRHPPQRDADLRAAEHPHRQALRRVDAAANLVVARPRRLRERVRDRVASWTSWRARAGPSPLEFRLRHLEDARGRAVLEAAAEAAGWTGAASGEFGRGAGVALRPLQEHGGLRGGGRACPRRRRQRRGRGRRRRDRRRRRRDRRPGRASRTSSRAGSCSRRAGR